MTGAILKHKISIFVTCLMAPLLWPENLVPRDLSQATCMSEKNLNMCLLTN